MTDLPESAADGADHNPIPDDATPSDVAPDATPSDVAPVGDPELAALVGGGPLPEAGVVPAATSGDPVTNAAPDESAPIGDPELAALVGSGPTEAAAPLEPAALAATDPIPETEPTDDIVPVVPVAAAVTMAEPAKPRRRRSLAFRFGVSFLLGALLAVGVGVGALYAWSQQYDGRVLPGVSVGATPLGGLTRDQAAAAIASAYSSLGAGQITLTGPDGHQTTISYTDIGRGPDTTAMVDAAFAAGRGPEPLENLISGPRTAIHGVTIGSAVAYDRTKLAAAIEDVATNIDQRPTNATISAGPLGSFSISRSKTGRAVDQPALLTALDRQLAALDAPSSIAMTVPVVSLAPAVDDASVQSAQATATRMAVDVVVSRGKETWKVAGTSIAPLISFWIAGDGTVSPVVDESGLDPIVKSLGKQVNQQVQDAGLKLVNGHIVATGASREGRTINAAGMKAAILGEIRARQAGAAATPVEAVVKAVNPKLTSDDANAFAGKMKVISSYSVYYWVIINNHWGGNIEAPATKINGTVVPAGGTFDFWKVVGDLHLLPGEGPGNAIEGGKITVTGAFGGGICTTSTTLFNAAFRAGMIPGARQNHKEYITRYPPGLDATVWIVGGAKQTMSFKNDTQYPILIQRVIRNDGAKRWLTFKIWSVPNGRTYKISDLVINNGPRAQDTIVQDPSKPVGYRFRNNAPADGAKVWVTVSIYDHGKLHWRKRYFSDYPAVAGVLVVGTRT